MFTEQELIEMLIMPFIILTLAFIGITYGSNLDTKIETSEEKHFINNNF